MTFSDNNTEVRPKCNADPVIEMARDIALARTGRFSMANEIIENCKHVWHDEIFEWAKDLIAAGWSKSA